MDQLDYVDTYGGPAIYAIGSAHSRDLDIWG